MLDKIIAFVVVSSANPYKYSVTLKGILTFVAGFLATTWLPDFDFAPLIGHIISAVEIGLMFTGAIVAVVGGIRKAIRTAHGENEALNELNRVQ